MSLGPSARGGEPSTRRQPRGPLLCGLEGEGEVTGDFEK